MTIELQFVSLFTMLFTGFYLGCMFDTNERMSYFLQAKKVLSFLFQFLFWFIQSLLIFLFLVKVNGGQVRLYFILAIVCGYWFYFISFQKVYQVLLDKFIAFFSKVILIIRRFFLFFMIKPVVFIVQAFLSLLNLAIIVVLKLFYFFLKLIEWILRPIFKVMPKNVKKYLVSFTKFYSKIVDRL